MTIAKAIFDMPLMEGMPRLNNARMAAAFSACERFEISLFGGDGWHHDPFIIFFFQDKSKLVAEFPSETEVNFDLVYDSDNS